MVEFNLWVESFIFVSIFSFIVITPCFFIGFIGRKLINELARYPSKAARIHMKYLIPIIIIEIFSFLGLIVFYQFFMNFAAS